MLKKLIVTLVILACTGFLYQKIALYRDAKQYPAPGKLVDIGGYKLHINELGSGTPTVVFDAGTGSFSKMWYAIPEEVAQFAHVYSYDRAGLGWSDESPLVRTSSTMIKELHTLLENVQAPKPYILVGHSLGGGHIQLYADTYPDEVFGLVLVDGGSEKILELMHEQHLTFKRVIHGFTVVADKHPELDGTTSLEKAFLWFATSNFGNTFLTMTGLKRLYLKHYFTSSKTAPYPVSPDMLACILKPSTFHEESQEIAHYGQSAQELARTDSQLSNKPLIVISNGKGFFYNPLCNHYITPTEKLFDEQIWPSLQKDLAAKSAKGKLVIATQSGHRIQDTEPELIVEAVKELVDDYRKTLAS